MLMKLLMIDQCITQGGSERGGGQVRQRRLFKEIPRVESCVGVERKGGETEKVPEDRRSVVGSWMAWLTHTHTHSRVGRV